MSEKPRVAVVTGGSRGIGRAAAERLAADGQSVVVGYSAGEAEAKAAVTAIEEAGGTAVAAQVEVGDADSVRALFDTAQARFGGIDVVVNAAGIMRLTPVADLDLAELERVHRVNVYGAFAVSREAARRLRPGGALIHFSTTVTRTLQPTYAAYAASKAAVEALVPVLARELAGRDITVNAVAPGPTATSMFLDGKSEELVRQITGRIPLGRLGEPADIAEVVSALAGPARWINGQTVMVNGGLA
ncbi:SDR family oxidoreductase [Streptomonospora nanhaiensis]|uniref:3-oxoacyl-[acyl-carrier protein] reductase n=1 Tax=Streptomonospora nanhaiensis TaxID=1323731 RepID=A0A853BX32_9ACTN|nr:SDR family oxidoreductase [Streptomonospora nanhaiensis]MBV2367022.1 SDR family oxidoreductase [Streptomonospora nanhaiensis]MBX9391274.1 SDR family oxidoreductase [Streptomonospora nanhaiensis]NYI99041.1 3-oxoacyl-[acyl-carrier protein] reductase [Streptomonospora nanhaiensis]